MKDHFTYALPEYQDATVLFKDHHKEVIKMNFNTLLCEMQFINPKGDTLEISKPEEIDSIIFSNTRFFYDKGYYQIIASSANVSLLVLRKATSEPVTPGPSSGEPVTSNRMVEGLRFMADLNNNHGQTPSYVVSQDIYVYDKISYLLLTPDGMIDASKNNFLKQFSSRKQDIDNYLSQHKTHFNKLPEIQNLFNFCVGR